MGNEPIPEGRYRAKATNPQFALSKKDTEQVVIDFIIEDGPMAGRSVFWYGSLSENQGKGTTTPFERTRAALRATGWTGSDITQYPGVGDKTVSITIEHSEYNGKISAKVQWVNPLVDVKPVPENRAQAAARKYKAKVLAGDQADASTAKNGKSTANKTQQSDEDDSVPF